MSSASSTSAVRTRSRSLEARPITSTVSTRKTAESRRRNQLAASTAKNATSAISGRLETRGSLRRGTRTARRATRSTKGPRSTLRRRVLLLDQTATQGVDVAGPEDEADIAVAQQRA